jgi:hypothetical protein
MARALLIVAFVFVVVDGPGCHVLGLSGEPCRGDIHCPADEHCDVDQHVCAAGAPAGEGEGAQASEGEGGEGEGGGGEGEGEGAEGEGGEGEGEGSGGEGEGSSSGEGEGAAGEGEGEGVGEGEGEGTGGEGEGEGEGEGGGTGPSGDPEGLKITISNCFVIGATAYWGVQFAATDAGTCHFVMTNNRFVTPIDITSITIDNPDFTILQPVSNVRLALNQTIAFDVDAVTENGFVATLLHVNGSRTRNIGLSVDVGFNGQGAIPVLRDDRGCFAPGTVDDAGFTCAFGLVNLGDTDTNVNSVSALEGGVTSTHYSIQASHGDPTTLPRFGGFDFGGLIDIRTLASSAAAPTVDPGNAVLDMETDVGLVAGTLSASWDDPKGIAVDVANECHPGSPSSGLLAQCDPVSLSASAGATTLRTLRLQNNGTVTIFVNSINDDANAAARVTAAGVLPMKLVAGDVRDLVLAVTPTATQGAFTNDVSLVNSLNQRNYGVVAFTGTVGP